MNMLLKNVTLDVFKSSGPGGQHKNKRFTAVRLTHHPTGIVVVAQKRRSLAANKALAFEQLEKKLQVLSRPVKQRFKTHKTRAARERTLEWKKKHAEKKSSRRQKYTQGE
ncbi:MAG: peptide chain release factor-like protein [Candidatus Omnitrophica bacterium]|nr:peptide chain release factor-like protein [Candidatus Omnitrophota bacterium]